MRYSFEGQFCEGNQLCPICRISRVLQMVVYSNLLI